MLIRYQENKKTGHLYMLAVTIGVYAFTLAAFLMYESTFKTGWFHAAYLSNIAGIILAFWVSVPRLIHFMNRTEDKISSAMYTEPILGLLSLFPFVFTYIIHCDQWNVAQPFVGDSIQLVMVSTFLMVAAATAGFLNGFRTLPRLHQFKLHKTTFHLPF